MALYTAEQASAAYEAAKKANGGKWNMSAADLATMNTDPDRFMGILEAQKGWMSANAAGNKEQKDYYHSLAEKYRAGNTDTSYSGGADGSQFLPYPNDGPSSFSTADFDYQYNDQMNEAMNKYLNTGDYNSAHAGDIDRLKNNILSQKDYNYNPANDPAYQAAYKQMIREANRATANTIGQVAGMTGGMPSTAAVSAAQQAGDNYRAAFQDNIANFMNADYQKYADSRADTYNQLSAIMQLDEADYQKWVDKVGLSKDMIDTLEAIRQNRRNEWADERNFKYGKKTDQLSWDADKQNADLAKASADIEQLWQIYDAYIAKGDTSAANNILNMIATKQGIASPGK